MSPRWLGTLLASRRADASLSVWALLDSDTDLLFSSPAFADGDPLPRRFAGTGVGDNVSPALVWSGVPVQADHLVFVLEDIDVPFSRPLIHTMSILDPDATALPEGALAPDSPAAPSVSAAQSRLLMLFAVEGDIDTSSPRAAVESMVGRVVARGRIVGTYER